MGTVTGTLAGLRRQLPAKLRKCTDSGGWQLQEIEHCAMLLLAGECPMCGVTKKGV